MIVREEEFPLAQGRLPQFQAAAAGYDWPDELKQAMEPILGPHWMVWVLAAIDSRESRFGILLQNGLGDHGHGHGELQIDDRSHGPFCASGKWQDLSASLAYIADNVILDSYNYLADHFELFDSDYAALFWGAIAAYNCGAGNVRKALEAGDDVDARTTGDDYSVDVRQRATIFRERLER